MPLGFTVTNKLPFVEGLKAIDGAEESKTDGEVPTFAVTLLEVTLPQEPAEIITLYL